MPNLMETSLYTACIDGYLNIVKLFIESGADVNIKDKNGITLLHLSCYNGHLNIVKLLIENGANVMIGVNAFGRICLNITLILDCPIEMAAET